MKISIAALFPELCESVLSASITGRAQQAGHITFDYYNIRDYSTDKHRRVDDTPYGGGMGMLMKPEPVYDCWAEVCKKNGGRVHTIFMTPQGKPFTQKRAVELSEMDHILLVCGHYEGIDERVIEEVCDEEISIGDYVLTGGELAALVVADAVARLCDGVLADRSCFEEESHYKGLLEYPQYTRPEIWREKKVPEVLLSGHHANIEKWRREQSLEKTRKKRPDLLEKEVSK